MMNQNWSESSVPGPLHIDNLIEFTILDGGRVGGGVGEGICGGAEDGGGVGGWGIHGNPCLIS